MSFLRNKRAEGFAFHKWLCSEESEKIGVIVHWGAEILRHFVPQNDRIGGKNDRLGSGALRCGDSSPLITTNRRYSAI
jgi:hypothetical protein